MARPPVSSFTEICKNISMLSLLFRFNRPEETNHPVAANRIKINLISHLTLIYLINLLSFKIQKILFNY